MEWWKPYGSERDAYTDAVELGLADEECPGGNTLRRRLKAETSIGIERRELFGLKRIR